MSLLHFNQCVLHCTLRNGASCVSLLSRSIADPQGSYKEQASIFTSKQAYTCMADQIKFSLFEEWSGKNTSLDGACTETKTGEKSSTLLAHTSNLQGIDPGQQSNSEMKTLERGGILGCTGAYVGIEGRGVQRENNRQEFNFSLGTSLCVFVCVSGPADVYQQMRRHYIRISGGRGLKGVP